MTAHAMRAAWPVRFAERARIYRDEVRHFAARRRCPSHPSGVVASSARTGVSSGQAEGVSGGVGVDQAVIGVRLEVEGSGAGREDPCLRGVEIVDEELEVHLHGWVTLGPLRGRKSSTC